jgi:hypothetical protein
MHQNRLALVATATFLMSLTAFAQEDYTRFKNDGAVLALGGFVTQNTQNGVQQGATDSTGVLSTHRYHFNRHSGVEVNYAWISNTQTYTGFGADTNSHEISAAYVFRMPMRRWSPFVLTGAGALILDPSNVAGANTEDAQFPAAVLMETPS